MENFEDLKEDTLQNMEDLLRSVSGSKRTVLAVEFEKQAAFWGTSTQTPIVSIREAINLLKTAALDFQCDCEVQGDVNQFSLN